MHSAASYEARSCEELRRIPFQWLKQKSILARALERVKEARPKVVSQFDNESIQTSANTLRAVQRWDGKDTLRQPERPR